LVKSRRSVRKYKSQAVAKEDILKILDAANWAPSAMNWQPWEFIVISGERLKQLGDSYKKVVNSFSQELYQKDDSKVISGDEFIKFAASYGGAPVIIVLLVKTANTPDAQNANIESGCASMQNLVLAAANLGLGTCWMTSPLDDESTLRHILDIPNDRKMVAVTPLGYPDTTPEALPRKDPALKDIIKWLD